MNTLWLWPEWTSRAKNRTSSKDLYPADKEILAKMLLIE